MHTLFHLPKLCLAQFSFPPHSPPPLFPPCWPTGRQIAGYVVKGKKNFELIGTRSPQDPQVGQLTKQLLINRILNIHIPANQIRSCTHAFWARSFKHHFEQNLESCNQVHTSFYTCKYWQEVDWEISKWGVSEWRHQLSFSRHSILRRDHWKPTRVTGW